MPFTFKHIWKFMALSYWGFIFVSKKSTRKSNITFKRHNKKTGVIWKFIIINNTWRVSMKGFYLLLLLISLRTLWLSPYEYFYLSMKLARSALGLLVKSSSLPGSIAPQLPRHSTYSLWARLSGSRQPFSN